MTSSEVVGKQEAGVTIFFVGGACGNGSYNAGEQIWGFAHTRQESHQEAMFPGPLSSILCTVFSAEGCS